MSATIHLTQFPEVTADFHSEFEWESPPQPANARWARRSAVALLLLVAICSLAIFMVFPGPTPVQPVDPVHPLNTQEFQVLLDKLEEWTDNREAKMAHLMDLFSANSVYFRPHKADVATITRGEYYINATGQTGCQSDFAFRARHTYTEENQEGFEITAKANAPTQEDATEAPLDPADLLDNDSKEKVERDQHPCYSKYSRETKIAFAEEQDIRSCGDLARLFPFAFPEDVDMTHAVGAGDVVYWFSREYKGKMNKSTKYKVTFTLSYESLEDARAGGVEPLRGEWSIRLYSLDNGNSPDWDLDVLTDTVINWGIVQAQFGYPAVC